MALATNPPGPRFPSSASIHSARPAGPAAHHQSPPATPALVSRPGSPAQLTGAVPGPAHAPAKVLPGSAGAAGLAVPRFPTGLPSPALSASSGPAPDDSWLPGPDLAGSADYGAVRAAVLHWTPIDPRTRIRALSPVLQGAQWPAVRRLSGEQPAVLMGPSSQRSGSPGLGDLGASGAGPMHRPRKNSFPRRSSAPQSPPATVPDSFGDRVDDDLYADRTFKLDVFSALKTDPKSLLTIPPRRYSFLDDQVAVVPAAAPPAAPSGGRARSSSFGSVASSKDSAHIVPTHTKPPRPVAEPVRTRDRSSSIRSERRPSVSSDDTPAATFSLPVPKTNKRPAEEERKPVIKRIKIEFPDPVPEVEWKGIPLNISAEHPLYHRLQAPELHACEVLRLWPDQYLHARDVILDRTERSGFLKKKDAKKLLRIDVNKTGKLYDW